MEVIKRDGSRVTYNFEKIRTAVNKAFAELNREVNDAFLWEEISKSVDSKYQEQNYITVEQIQDIVEECLCDCGFIDEARSYIKYRYDHEIARIQKQEKIVEEKLMAQNVANQNANVDEHSFGGRMGEANSAVMKQYALDHCMSKMARENHLNNEIYIHDLDAYAVGMHNCLSIPFDDLLAKGFNTRQTDVRPANSVNTAMQLVAVIFQLQSLQQFGGVSATHLDWTMVPYVRKSFAKHYKDGFIWIEKRPYSDIDYEIDNMIKNAADYSITDPEWKAYSHDTYDYAIAMTIKEIHQAVEGMYHNLNTLQSRSGNQLERVAA